MKYARDYMKAVQRICNSEMNFFPRVFSICVYGGTTTASRERVYAKEILPMIS